MLLQQSFQIGNLRLQGGAFSHHLELIGIVAGEHLVIELLGVETVLGNALLDDQDLAFCVLCIRGKGGNFTLYRPNRLLEGGVEYSTQLFHRSLYRIGVQLQVGQQLQVGDVGIPESGIHRFVDVQYDLGILTRQLHRAVQHPDHHRLFQVLLLHSGKGLLGLLLGHTPQAGIANGHVAHRQEAVEQTAKAGDHKASHRQRQYSKHHAHSYKGIALLCSGFFLTGQLVVGFVQLAELIIIFLFLCHRKFS